MEDIKVQFTQIAPTGVQCKYNYFQVTHQATYPYMFMVRTDGLKIMVVVHALNIVVADDFMKNKFLPETWERLES